MNRVARENFPNGADQPSPTPEVLGKAKRSTSRKAPKRAAKKAPKKAKRR